MSPTLAGDGGVEWVPKLRSWTRLHRVSRGSATDLAKTPRSGGLLLEVLIENTSGTIRSNEPLPIGRWTVLRSPSCTRERGIHAVQSNSVCLAATYRDRCTRFVAVRYIATKR